MILIIRTDSASASDSLHYFHELGKTGISTSYSGHSSWSSWCFLPFFSNRASLSSRFLSLRCHHCFDSISPWYHLHCWLVVNHSLPIECPMMPLAECFPLAWILICCHVTASSNHSFCVYPHHTWSKCLEMDVSCLL